MENNLKYKDVSYWNSRYAEEEHFEWFGAYSRFQHVIEQKVSRSYRILVLGCGNSRMSEAMYADGFTHIVNMDYSPVIIERMRQRCATLTHMSWCVMDINNIEFAAESFDCVLEKGTLDALLVDEKDPWTMSASNAAKMDHIMQSISRILKPGGVFLSLTFAQAHFRVPLYAHENYGWSVEQQSIGDAFHYFAYTMTKGGTLDPACMRFRCRQQQQHQHEKSTQQTMPLDLNENFLLSIETD